MRKVTLGDLNHVLTPKLYKQIAKILVPEKEWVKYRSKNGLVRVIATDGSELFHYNFPYKTYKFMPEYWNAYTGSACCEEIIDIVEKMKEIFKLIKS